ncbi:MAG TPA: hypothetical protein VGJ19_10705 [Streptosporangiaceae bacterium]
MKPSARRLRAGPACALVAAGELVLAGAVACGSQAAHPEAGGSTAAASSSPAPIPAAILNAVTGGSKVLGMSLARVKGFGFGSDMTRPHLAWLVSVDPWGGAYGVTVFGCGRITYDVELIDPDTGSGTCTRAPRPPTDGTLRPGSKRPVLILEP